MWTTPVNVLNQSISMKHKPIMWREAAEYFRIEGPNLVWRNTVKGAHKAGDVVGSKQGGYVCLNWRREGYNQNTRSFRAHRIIYALGNQVDLTGGEIDHINGVRDDNRLENLRIVSVKDNAQNRKRSKLNTTGRTGVVFRDRIPKRKWEARIVVDQKQKHLGCYESLDEAAAARKEAEVKYGFHENHDRITDTIYDKPKNK